MNKYILVFFCTIGVLACQKEVARVIEQPSVDGFTAIMEGFDADTRTMLSDSSARWTANDAIVVFQGDAKVNKFVLADARQGTFRREGDILTSKNDFDANVAIYPYNSSVKLEKTNTDSYTINYVSFPDEQYYVKDSFAEEAFVMMAVTAKLEDRELVFKNVCGGLRLQIKGRKGVKVDSIKLTGNNEEQIAGMGKVEYVKDKEIVSFNSFTSSSKTDITLICGGVELDPSEETEFIIALPPVTFDEGFTVTVNASEGDRTISYVRSSSTIKYIRRSRILTMPVFMIVEDGDYVDEYGINHGQGTDVDGVIWAPVNCGYKAASDADKGYPYGKLYQWGRKYGQGYDSTDASYPKIVPGPIDLATGQSQENAAIFYSNAKEPNDWCDTQNDNLWNAGTDSEPVKTEYDPCPDGWRVPTFDELSSLRDKESVAPSGSEYILLPAGCRHYETGEATQRGKVGFYWSSTSISDGCQAGCVLLDLSSEGRDIYATFDRANGYSVRCVKE